MTPIIAVLMTILMFVTVSFYLTLVMDNQHSLSTVVRWVHPQRRGVASIIMNIFLVAVLVAIIATFEIVIFGIILGDLLPW